MKFRIFLLTLLVLSTALLAQENRYIYNLTLDDSTHVLSGSAKLSLKNTSPKTLDTVYVHLPSRSLEWKNSFLNRQLTDFQKIDAYYAKSEETGYIDISSLTDGYRTFSVCEECEFVPLSLSPPLASGDSVQLEIGFKLKLGSTEFNGVGYDGEMYRIIDWLPNFPTMDSSGFRLYPVTFYRDQFPANNHYKLSLTLPSDMIVASNAELTSAEEKARLVSILNNPVKTLPTEEPLKTLEFRHYGTNLQFLVSRFFNVYQMKNGGHFFSTSDDPFYPSLSGKVTRESDEFFQRELGDSAVRPFNLVLLTGKNSEYQSDDLLTLEIPDDIFKFSSELAHARAEQLLRYQMRPNGFRDVWMARGLPYFYKYSFINQVYPDQKWLPFSNTFIGRFFALDQFDYSYQNQFLFLYLARQNLDQKMIAPADSLTRLNYEAIAQAKTYMALSHVRQYISPRSFARGMNRYVENYSGIANAHSLQKSLEYFCNRDVDWFFNKWIKTTEIYDYQLIETDHCPTISTATVKNTGSLVIPYSLTGFKDGNAVLTEWFDGHEGKKSVQMYHEEYDKVVLNYHGHVPEYRQKNNTYYERLFFPRLEPLRLQFYYSFEDPKHSQLYWTPTVNFNAYDKVLLGLSLDNSSLVQKPFEYIIGPEYSTGTGKLTGYTSFIYHLLPKNNSIFHQIRFGLFGRYYHYDKDLAYLRLSPSLNFYFKKPYPTSSILQTLKFRLVNLDRELPGGFSEPANEIGNSSYTVFNASYELQETDILNPFTLRADYYLGDDFQRIGIEGDFRWMLSNKKWLIWRNYFGYFFYNRYKEAGISNSYYSLGLSGTKDFLFDYQFFGRSDESGIWSQQFFVTEGGFKTFTGTFADEVMFTTNLSVPIWKFFGVFADAGIVDSNKKFYYDFGIRLSFITDFLEVYFPLINQDVNFLEQPAYFNSIRFVLDIDQSNIINRLRRGYY